MGYLEDVRKNGYSIPEELYFEPKKEIVMKAYAIKYDILIGSNTKQRIENYSDLADLIDRVKYLDDKYYISNLSVYSGELKEVDINKVLNPF